MSYYLFLNKLNGSGMLVVIMRGDILTKRLFKMYLENLLLTYINQSKVN